MSTAAKQSNVRKLPSRKGDKPLAFAPERIWIDKEVVDHPQTIRILNKLRDADCDVVDDVRKLKNPSDISSAKREMILTTHRGVPFKPCQGIGEGHLCCSYRVLDLTSGCPMDCSYCILQSYLANNPRTTVYVNIESMLSEVSQFLSKHTDKFFRIGTGELADSLALDQITEYSSLLVPFFASKRNAILELKTKTNLVDQLIGLRHANRTVIAWSVNTPSIIASEEMGTTTLDERIAAAQKTASAGYGVAFHFDPIILGTDVDASVQEYVQVAEKILSSFEPRQISWISLGLLRFPKGLDRIATKRFKDTRIYSGELVPAGSKMRYLRFIREKAYLPIWQKLASKISTHKLYLCMETDAVWEKIDPTVTSNRCIEKRLCNTENISFEYRF